VIKTFRCKDTEALFNRQRVARFDTETAKDTLSTELAKIKPWSSEQAPADSLT
jgi:hypothetical protein